MLSLALQQLAPSFSASCCVDFKDVCELGSHNKGYSTLGFILGSPIFGNYCIESGETSCCFDAEGYTGVYREKVSNSGL